MHLDGVKLKSVRGLEQLTQFRILEVRDCCELEELPTIKNMRSLDELCECVWS